MRLSAVQYLLWIGGGIAVSVIVSWTLISAHAATPHKGSVTQTEFRLMMDQIKEIRGDVKELRQYILRDR